MGCRGDATARHHEHIVFVDVTSGSYSAGANCQRPQRLPTPITGVVADCGMKCSAIEHEPLGGQTCSVGSAFDCQT